MHVRQLCSAFLFFEGYSCDYTHAYIAYELESYLEVLLQLQRQLKTSSARAQQLQQVCPQTQYVVASRAYTLYIMVSV